MTRDNLELISKAIAQIKEIDKRIDNIKKMAVIAADKPIDSFLKLSVKDISIDKESSLNNHEIDLYSPVLFDTFHHKLMNYLDKIHQGSESSPSAKRRCQKQGSAIGIEIKPDNCTTLRVLEILLQDIMMERNHYKNQLKRIGVEI